MGIIFSCIAGIVSCIGDCILGIIGAIADCLECIISGMLPSLLLEGLISDGNIHSYCWVSNRNRGLYLRLSLLRVRVSSRTYVILLTNGDDD